MGLKTARILTRAGAGLLALCIGSGENLFAADAPAPAVVEERPVIENIVETIAEKIPEKIGEKIGEKIDDAIGEETVAKIDKAHEEQARFLGEVFEKIDRVFGEQYVEDRDRKIQVRAGLETTFNDDGTSTNTKVKVGARVPLPAMKRRFNIFVDIGEDVNQLGAVTSPNFTAADKAFSLAAGLIHRFRENMEAGIKLRLLSAGQIMSVNPFVRFEKQRDSARYYFEEKIVWETDNSWGSQTAIDLDYRFRSGVFFRLSNRIGYAFEDPGAYFAHGLILRQGLFGTSGLSLEQWFEYNTAGDDLATVADDTITYTQLRMRGRIWRNWLEYELRPIYTIPLNTDRSAFFGFFVSLTVVWDSYLGGAGTPETNLGR